MGPSIVLCDPASDNNVPANWLSATTQTGKITNGFEILANPNAASGCPTGTAAVDDQGTIQSGGTITTNVIANDLVPGTFGTLTIVTQPAHGTVTINAANTITYVGAPGYCGPDTYTYRVCNTANQCDDANVTITAVCYPVRTIAQMTTEGATGVADSTTKTCTMEGVVNITNLRTNGLQFSMQDGGAGITVFRGTGNFGYTPTINQRVRVQGTIQQFNGLIQIIADTVIATAITTVIAPSVITTLAEDQESEFVQINRVLRLVDPVQWATGVGTGFTVFAVDTAIPTDTVSIRVDNDITDFFTAPPPAGPFSIQGVCSQFDSTDPFTSGYQIFPRKIGDIVTLATFEPLEIDLTFAPNPVQDLLRLTMSEQVDRLIVTDMAGRQVTAIESPALQTQIATAQWAAGAYAVTLWSAGKSLTVRVVKQ
jgi:Bacterial Ig domain